MPTIRTRWVAMSCITGFTKELSLLALDARSKALPSRSSTPHCACRSNVRSHPLARVGPTGASRVQAMLGDLIVVLSFLPSVAGGGRRRTAVLGRHRCQIPSHHDPDVGLTLDTARMDVARAMAIVFQLHFPS